MRKKKQAKNYVIRNSNVNLSKVVWALNDMFNKQQKMS